MREETILSQFVHFSCMHLQELIGCSWLFLLQIHISIDSFGKRTLCNKWYGENIEQWCDQVRGENSEYDEANEEGEWPHQWPLMTVRSSTLTKLIEYEIGLFQEMDVRSTSIVHGVTNTGNVENGVGTYGAIPIEIQPKTPPCEWFSKEKKNYGILWKGKLNCLNVSVLDTPPPNQVIRNGSDIVEQLVLEVRICD